MFWYKFGFVSVSIHNLKHLKKSRKELRNAGTSAESVMWTYLNRRQLLGRKFRRQQSIQNYIVDFYCPQEKLIIELDGQSHFDVGGQVYDEHRDEILIALGFTILHFENKMIFECIDGVLDEIAEKFKDCRDAV